VSDSSAIRRSLLDRILLVFATGFGTGYAPVASGTVGSLVGIPLVILIRPWIEPGAYVSGVCFVVGFSLFGVWCSNAGERTFRKKDDGRVVIDEVAGYLVTMLWIPQTWVTLTIGFFLSRILDIVKPFPAYRSQKLKSGWGIMVDDLIAAVYANIVLRIVLLVFGW
jgi:phosphatidylglycerophosphatase A